MRSAAGDQPAAPGYGVVDVFAHPGYGAVVDQRADGDALVEAVADPELLHGVGQFFDEAV